MGGAGMVPAAIIGDAAKVASHGSSPLVPSPAATPPRALVTDLLAPLRLPGRLVAALESAVDALQEVRPIRADVGRIRKQSESLDELLPALESLKADLGGRLDGLHHLVETLEGVEEHMDTTVADLGRQLTAVHQTVLHLQDDVQRITNRLPDPNEPGPLERARDALTGGGD